LFCCCCWLDKAMAHATNCVLPTTGTEKFRDEIQKNTARNIEQKGKL